MSVEFTDGYIKSVLITVVDKDGRSASVSFDDEHVIFHKRRPHQGKKAVVSLARLLDLALLDNTDFFDPVVHTKHRRASGT